MLKDPDVLVIAPFRRPTFRQAIASTYPRSEPWDSAPLSVAAVLEASGFTVEYLALQNIFDAWGTQNDEAVLDELLRDLRPRVAIFASDSFIPSRSTATTFGIRIVADALRSRGDVVTGLAGRLATTAGARVLDAMKNVDFYVFGEPESTIGPIVEGILRVGVDHATHPNLFSRGTLAASTAGAPLTEVDTMPAPAWHLLPRSINAWDRLHKAGDVLPFSMRTSFGCKFRCRFCAGVPHWLDYRKKTPERVGREIDGLIKATDGRGRVAFLEDEIFTKDPAHVAGVADVFEERGIRVDGVYTHSSLMTQQIARLLVRMAHKVYFGLDNANDRALKHMRKGQRFDTVMTAVGIAREAGLATHLEWIIGSPADDVETLTSSLNAIVNLLATGAVDSVDTYVYCPHPGTEYADNPGDFGLEVTGELEDMQESGGYPAFRTKNLSGRQVFTAYLMSQLAIAEVTRARTVAGASHRVGRPARAELARILGAMRE